MQENAQILHPAELCNFKNARRRIYGITGTLNGYPPEYIFLEVVTPTDIPALLARIPECRTLVTTGEKASTIVSQIFSCPVPPVGGYVDIEYETPDQVGGDGGVMPDSVVMPGPDRASLRFWRMPSTSRAYPLPLKKKAEAYRQLF